MIEIVSDAIDSSLSNDVFLMTIKKEIFEDLRAFVKKESSYFNNDPTNQINMFLNNNLLRLVAISFEYDESEGINLHDEIFDVFEMVDDIDRVLVRFESLAITIQIKYGKLNVQMIIEEIKQIFVDFVVSKWEADIYTQKLINPDNMKNIKKQEAKLQKRTREITEYYDFLFNKFSSLWLLVMLKTALNR